MIAMQSSVCGETIHTGALNPTVFAGRVDRYQPADRYRGGARGASPPVGRQGSGAPWCMPEEWDGCVRFPDRLTPKSRLLRCMTLVPFGSGRLPAVSHPGCFAMAGDGTFQFDSEVRSTLFEQVLVLAPQAR